MSALGIFSFLVLVAIVAGVAVQALRDRRRKAELAQQAARMSAPSHPVFQERQAADIWAARLVTLCVRSGTVFPHPVGRAPTEGVWSGTVYELRDALLCGASRLHRSERAEVPPVSALAHRLSAMMHGAGRIRVEHLTSRPAGPRGGAPIWKLTLTH